MSGPHFSYVDQRRGGGRSAEEEQDIQGEGRPESECYGLNVCAPPNPYVRKLPPKFIVLRCEPLRGD